MKIAILGLSITSSWGNGHATTYRALVRALALRGHDVVFLERDAPWYAENRDLPNPPYCRTRWYSAVAELERRHLSELRSADLIIVGSYVPDGIAVGDLVLRRARGLTAFYDIDTPVTLARLKEAGNRVSDPASDTPVRFVSFVYRRAHTRSSAGHVRRTAGAAAVLLGRP